MCSFLIDQYSAPLCACVTSSYAMYLLLMLPLTAPWSAHFWFYLSYSHHTSISTNSSLLHSFCSCVVAWLANTLLHFAHVLLLYKRSQARDWKWAHKQQNPRDVIIQKLGRKVFSWPRLEAYGMTISSYWCYWWWNFINPFHDWCLVRQPRIMQRIVCDDAEKELNVKQEVLNAMGLCKMKSSMILWVA